MDLPSFLQVGAMPAALVPFFVFAARVVDVSLGTLRIIVVSRGNRLLASVLGFTEVFIWLLAIGQVLGNLNGWISYLSYSAGFGAGTFVGMTLERRLVMGTALIRIIVPHVPECTHLFNNMKETGYRVTHVRGEGTRGPVDIFFSVVKRKRLRAFHDMVHKYRPDAFFSIEDVRHVRDVESTDIMTHHRHHLLQPFFWFRKGK